MRLGTTPQETGLPASLKVREVVEFVGAHYPHPIPTAELLDTFGLTALAGRQTGGMSGGEKRRLAVALAVVGRPDLVLLDEPTTGLDVDARRILWDTLRAFHAAGTTVVVTSHYLEEIEALAERVVVVDHGRVLADAPLPRDPGAGGAAPGHAGARGAGRRGRPARRGAARDGPRPAATSCSRRTPTRWCASWCGATWRSATSRCARRPSRRPSWP